MLSAVKTIGEYVHRTTSDKENRFVESSKLKNVRNVWCINFDHANGKMTYTGIRTEEFDIDQSTRYLYREFMHNKCEVTPTSKLRDIKKLEDRFKYWFEKYCSKYDRPELIKDYASVIRGAREKAGYTHEDMGLEINEKPFMLKNIELGKKKPDNRLATKLERFLEIKLLEYIDVEGKPVSTSAASKKEQALFLQALEKEFSEKKEIIFSEIDERKKHLNNEKDIRNTIVTITIDSSKYLDDFEIFRDILRKETCDGLYLRHKIESKGTGKCFLCGVEKEVLGFASPFPVYTLEKKGFAPNFQREDSWKLLPLCMNCATLSISGREFVEKNLYKKFYSINFYVIPSFALKFDDDVFSCLTEPKKDYWAIVGNEDNVSDIMASNEQVTLTFVFTVPENATFRIVGYVEDVPPSHIRTIKQITTELMSSHGQQESVFNEQLLKVIYRESKFAGDFRAADVSLGGLIQPFFDSRSKYFVDLVSNILAQREIRAEFLTNAFMRALRASFVKNHIDKTTKVLALKSLMLTLLTSKLNILRYRSGVQLMPSDGNDEIDTFFNQYKLAFDTSSKQAVFLEGVLTKFLLDEQSVELNSTSPPFMDKLWGLQIDEKRAKKLYPEIIMKLREYKIEEHCSLETKTAKALLVAENKGWNLTADEVSYFFTLGLILAPIFRK